MNSYTRMTDFQKRFHEYCIECDAEQKKYSMFHGYVKLCREIALSEDSAITRQYNMAAWIAACKHWPRAIWVARHLFKDYQHMLVGDIDLVLWGCGAGLELLAIYDQALQCDIPQIWTVVRSVTLIDCDREYSERAKEIAEVLFPMARGKIKSLVCDFNNAMDVSFLSADIQSQVTDRYTPRVHILSHSIIRNSDTIALSKAIKSAVVMRNKKGEPFFNEIFAASAPGKERVELYARMREFELIWNEERGSGEPEDVQASPLGVYYAFHCFTDNPLCEPLRSENPIFRNLLGMARSEPNQIEWSYMISALARRMVRGRAFADVYGYVKEIYLRSNLDRYQRCLYFAPFAGVEVRGFIVMLGKPDVQNRYEKMNLAKSWLFQFERNSNLDSIKELARKLRHVQRGQVVKAEYRQLMRIVRLIAWNFDSRSFVEFPGRFEENDELQVVPCDHSAFFGISEDDLGEVLPETLNLDQRNIVYSRRRQRLIRGGPGTGKTLTMLHHALVAYKRTHLPVLLVTKTNSLIGNNSRRLLGSYRRLFPSERILPSDAICVLTINTLICELARGLKIDGDRCLREKCKKCLGECIARADRGPKVPHCNFGCCDPVSASYAVGISRQYPDGSPVNCKVERMNVLSSACDFCNERICVEVAGGNPSIPVDDQSLMRAVHLFRTWGAVLIDEAQLINADLLSVVWRLTEHFNPLREFYVFADEEQSLHEDALVQAANGKMTVAAPGTNFGRWKTLKGNHRVKSRALLRIYRKLQEIMAQKYESNELMMDMPTYELEQQQSNIGRVFRIMRRNELPLFGELYDIVKDHSRWAGSETVVIIIDEEQAVRDFYLEANRQKWKLTHLNEVQDEKDKNKERDMRKRFQEEEGKVHLTTIDCAQGRTFENVIFVVTRDATPNRMEEAFTGFTRASMHLQVIDNSPSGWVSDMLGDMLGIDAEHQGPND